MEKMPILRRRRGAGRSNLGRSLGLHLDLDLDLLGFAVRRLSERTEIEAGVGFGVGGEERRRKEEGRRGRRGFMSFSFSLKITKVRVFG